VQISGGELSGETHRPLIPLFEPFRSHGQIESEGRSIFPQICPGFIRRKKQADDDGGEGEGGDDEVALTAEMKLLARKIATDAADEMVRITRISTLPQLLAALL
jgi:hypothetical protein